MSLPFSYSLSNEKVKQKIQHLINEINQFNDIEKLLLYIQLPSGSPANDPLKHKGPGNPFGKKADVEVAQTYTWIQSHLEEDPTVSLPKHEVYDEYRFFCQANSFEPLCVADFGKAMKHVFPGVKPRRLGQRGNSKYCYSGLRKKLTLPAPCLPDLSNTSTSLNNSNVNSNVDVNSGKTNGDERRINKSNSTEEDSSSDPSLSTGAGEAFRADSCTGISSFNINSDNVNGISCIYGKHQHVISPDIVQNAATRLILDWAEGILEQNFSNLQELGKYLINYDLVDKTSVAAIALISSSAPAPPTPTTPGSLSTLLPMTSEDVKYNASGLNSKATLTNHQAKSKRGDGANGQTKKSLIKEVTGNGTNNRRKGSDRSVKTVSVISSTNTDSGVAIDSATNNQQTESSATMTRVNRRSRRLSMNGNGRTSMETTSECALGVNGDNYSKPTDNLHLNIKKETNHQLYDVDSSNIIENTSNTSAAVAPTNTSDDNKTGSVMLKNSISQNKIPIPKGGTSSSSSHQLIVLPNNVRLPSTITRSMSQILSGDKSGSQSVPVSCLSSSITTTSTTSSSSSSSSSSLAASSTRTSSCSTTTSLSSSSSSTIKSISLTSPPSLSTVTQKYKRIQPKPVSLNRSNSNVLESTFNYSTINEHKTSTSTLSSSTSNNISNNNKTTNIVNSSQNRNNNLGNNSKSNEVEGLIVTRRHSLASVTLTGNELQSTNCNKEINFTRRESVLGLVVTGCGVNGGGLTSPSSSSSSSSSTTISTSSSSSSCSSSPCIKDERISLDKTQIKRSCDVSRDSDNVSCKKRFTSSEACEGISTSTPSSSTSSSTLLATNTSTAPAATNGNLTGIILTLANGDVGARLSDETNSSTSLSPLPSMSMTEDVLLTGLTDNGLNDLNGDNHHHNQNMLHHQQQLGLMNITSNKTSNGMSLKFQELECDALNDDLNEQQPRNQQHQQQQHGGPTSSLMDSYEDCNPSTLSQLRRLLEKNLPNSKSNNINVGLSSSSSASASSAVSSEHIYNANVINNNVNHHSHHQQHIQHNSPNNVNNINISTINNGIHEIMEQQIVGYEETNHQIHHQLHHQQQQQQQHLNHLHNINGDIKLEEKKDIIGSTNNSFGLVEHGSGKKSIDCNSPMLISNLTDSDSVVFIANDSLNSIVNPDSGNNQVNSMVSSIDYCNMQTQVPSVPASPNTRRQAFNFQPISSRITPTIPENSAIGSATGTGNLSSNIVNGNTQQQPQHASPSFSSNQRSIGVGISQPPSSANSPFVSPRGTPIPLSRSRHDSGQSGYSGPRATPYPVLDSGLSSISSSPFISPQSTPVPLSGRMRAISNSYSHHHTRSSLVNRARHSSGPGNPYTTLSSSISGSGLGIFSNRSSSVSPMVVSCNGNDLLSNNNQQGATLASINAAFGEVKQRTRNQSSTTTGTTTTSGVSSIGTPVSPKSEPLSPSSVLISGDISTSDLASIGIGSSSSSSANGDSYMDSCFSSRDWLTNNSRYLQSGYHGLLGGVSMGGGSSLLHGGSEGSHVGPVLRQRHFSSPYATIANNGNNFSLHDSHSKEIQNLLKGSSFIESLLSSNNHTNNHHHSENNINDSGENSNGSSLAGNLSNGGSDHHLSGSPLSSTLTDQQHHGNNGRPLLNRCHSVPIQHLGKLYNGLSTASSVPSPSMDQNSFTPSSSLCSPADPNSPPDRDFSSKSYPPTPLCNPNFSFPPFSPSNNISRTNNSPNAGGSKPNSGANSISSPTSVGSTRLKLVEEETTLGSLVVDNASTVSPSSNSGFLESGQDVMVSGLQSKEWSVGESVMGTDDIELTVNHTGHHYHHQSHHQHHQGQHDHHQHHNPHDPDLSPVNGLLNTFEVRRAIDDAISGPTPMSDDLETTLEDLRDCDNDFSKFALELELEANGSTKFDDI